MSIFIENMRLFSIYIAFLTFLLLAGCGLGGDIPSPQTRSYKELQNHTKMDWFIRITAMNDSIQSKSLSVSITYPDYPLFIDTVYYSHFFNLPQDSTQTDSTQEYLTYMNYPVSPYQSDAERIQKYLNENVGEKKRFETIADSNGHVVFSLFDKGGVEKKYDIDVSGFIKFLERPYELRGDSVNVLIPEGISTISYYGTCTCAECGSSMCFNEVYVDSLKNRTYSTDIATVWGNGGKLDLVTRLGKQSSLKTDSISITLEYHFVY